MDDVPNSPPTQVKTRLSEVSYQGDRFCHSCRVNIAILVVIQWCVGIYRHIKVSPSNGENIELRARSLTEPLQARAVLGEVNLGLKQ